MAPLPRAFIPTTAILSKSNPRGEVWNEAMLREEATNRNEKMAKKKKYLFVLAIHPTS